METDLGNQIRELIDTGAQPVSFLEVTRRPAAAARRAPVRRRTVITRTACGVAAAGCAAGLAVAFASPGAHPPSVAQPAPHTETTSASAARSASPATSAGQASAFLTAATVRHMAVASRAALANSGQEQIRYRCVKDGTVTSAGLDTVTYSGSNWQYAVAQSVPAALEGVSRVVDGKFYIKGEPSAPWILVPDENGAAHFPRAATLLRLLSPAAAFRNEGTEVTGGRTLTHLHATKLSGLPDDPTLGRYASLVAEMKSATVSPGTLTGLDLWADSAGVVHQMRILLEGGDGQATVTVTFTGIGQPQTIQVPPLPAPAS